MILLLGSGRELLPVEEAEAEAEGLDVAEAELEAAPPEVPPVEEVPAVAEGLEVADVEGPIEEADEAVPDPPLQNGGFLIVFFGDDDLLMYPPLTSFVKIEFIDPPVEEEAVPAAEAEEETL